MAAGEQPQWLQDVCTKIQCLKLGMAPFWFREGECVLCRDGGVGLSQAGCGFVFVLKLGENSVLMSN
jgi:hypothetical protein